MLNDGNSYPRAQRITRVVSGIAGMSAVLVFGLFFVGMITGFVDCNGTYSEGFRDGHLQKFASKGLFFKSWEGELATPGVRMNAGTASSVWEFSVDDPEIVIALKDVQPNSFIRIHYRQVWCNSWWYMTDYRATKIDIIQPK